MTEDFRCQACRRGDHAYCDWWRGCECALIGVVDGVLVYCPGMERDEA